MQTIFRDVWEIKEARYEVLEAASSPVDGVHVLGLVRGPMFVPNGESRNRRYYPREVWERILQDPTLEETLQARRMFGTIGHASISPVAMDDALRQGLFSHVITRLWIDDKTGLGMGEALVLGTPTGKILNTYLRAGVQLYASTYAEGSYDSHRKHNGMPVVKELRLQRIDFVYEPGFLQAKPELVEALKEALANTTSTAACTYLSCLVGEDLASRVWHISREDNTEDMQQEDAMKDQLESLKVEMKQLATSLKALQEDKAQMEEEYQALKEELARLQEENQQLRDQLQAYQALGEPEDISKALDQAEEVISAYKALGAPEDLEAALEALEKAEEALQRYKELGEPEEIDEALDRLTEALEAYRRLGAPEDIEQVFDGTEAILSKLADYGTVDDIADALNKAEELATAFESISRELEAYRISYDKGLPFSKVKELLEKGLDAETIEEVLKSPQPTKGAASGAEFQEHHKPLQRPLGESLLKRFS